LINPVCEKVTKTQVFLQKLLVQMMALYAEHGGHVAKRPRVDYSAATQLQITTATGNLGHHGGGGGGLLSPHYIEQQLTRKSHEPEKPNHILLFTVLNPTYPITCDVLDTIFRTKVGTQALRIVIFRKNGVQAMVELDSVDTAKSAKELLHGSDIYSGCCTLKIEYAKPTKLNVYKNDTDSFDFTNPNLGKNGSTMGSDGSASSAISAAAAISQRPVLLKEPVIQQNHQVAAEQAAALAAAVAAGASPATNGLSLHSHHRDATGGYENGMSISSLPTTIEVLNSANTASGLARIHTEQVLRGGTAILSSPMGLVTTNAAAQQVANGNGSQAGYQHQGSVCMVYGLNPDKMNAARLFNLFCLYGNVVRIKFLKTKEGCAMVQMGDALAVERAVSNLNNTNFFGSKMQLGFSKQAFLADVQSPYQLADGTPSFQDFMGSKNNRFINPEMASKNRIQPPSKILHFFNTPPGLEANDVEILFTGHGSPKPKCVKMFPSKTERSSSGLIEFESLGDALEGLVICNHQPVANPNSKFPYIMKLCFSSSRSIPTTIR
jgi:heterogeneous nuclear ribonucleoprotein L